MNRIAKIWEELDHKQGRVKLSATAKKKRNVKLSLVEEFQDAMTTAQNVEDMKALENLQELMIEAEDLFAKIQRFENLGYLEIGFFEELKKNIETYAEELVSKGQDLGIDIFDTTDYNLGDVNYYIDHLLSVISAQENAVDAVQNIKI